MEIGVPSRVALALSKHGGLPTPAHYMNNDKWRNQAISQLCAFLSPFCGDFECYGDVTTIIFMAFSVSKKIATTKAALGRLIELVRRPSARDWRPVYHS